MSNTKIYIEGLEIDSTEDIVIPLNFSALNLRDISKTSSPYSKTITVPGSKNNNRIFNMLYSPQVIRSEGSGTLFQNFDFKKKHKAEVFRGSLLLFQGYARLISSSTKDNEITFQVSLVSDIADFANTLSDKRLEDLPATLTDQYTHLCTKDAILESWQTGEYFPATSYIYVMGDFGSEGRIHGSVQATNFYMSSLRCSLFAKQYLDMIFEAAGFTYTSSFLSGNYFRRLVIPYKDGLYKSTGGYSATVQSCEEVPLTGRIKKFNPQDVDKNGEEIFECVISDPSEAYTDTYYTAEVTSAYDAEVKLEKLAFEFAPNTTIRYGLSNNAQRLWIVYEIFSPDMSTSRIERTYAHTWAPNEIFNSITFNTPNGGGWKHITEDFSINNIPVQTFTMQEGEHLKVKLYLASTSSGDDAVPIWNFAAGNIKGTAKLFVKEPATLRVSTSVNMENGLVTYNDFCLKDVKQVDFVSSVLKLFGLIIVPDKLKERHFNIYTSEEYYKAGHLSVLDWSDKVDYSQAVTVKPIPSLQDGSLRYAYKSDTDYWSEVYRSQTGLDYGERVVSTGYEFSNSTKDVIADRTIFSASIPVQYLNELIASETTFETLNSDKDIISITGYRDITGDLPTDDSVFRNAKEGVHIWYSGDQYTIAEVINPCSFRVDRDLVRAGGAVDGTFLAKADTFSYLADQNKVLGICVYESKDNNLTRTEKKVNPRILYYQGMKPCADWHLQYTPTLIGKQYVYQASPHRWSYDTYPVFSHLDDNENPKRDLLFATPVKTYFSIPNYPIENSSTFSNLYKGWENTTQEIVDNNAKMLTAWLRLLPSDIANFDPRQRVYINGSYYRVNAITDYTCQPNELTFCEFIKCPDLMHYPSNVDPSAECKRYKVWNRGLSKTSFLYMDCDGVIQTVELEVNADTTVCGLSGSFQLPNLFSLFDLGMCEDEPEGCKNYALVNNSFINIAVVSYIDCAGDPQEVLLIPNTYTELCLSTYDPATVPGFVSIAEIGECVPPGAPEVNVINDTEALTITNILNVPGSLWTNPVNIAPETSQTLYRDLVADTANVQCQVTGTGRAWLEMYLNDTLMSSATVNNSGNYNMANRTFLADTEIRIEMKPIPAILVEVFIQGTGEVTHIINIPNLTFTLPTSGSGLKEGSREQGTFTASLQVTTTKITGSITLSINGTPVQCINLNGISTATYTFTSRTFNATDVIRFSLANSACL